MNAIQRAFFSLRVWAAIIALFLVVFALYSGVNHTRVRADDVQIICTQSPADDGFAGHGAGFVTTTNWRAQRFALQGDETDEYLISSMHTYLSISGTGSNAQVGVRIYAADMDGKPNYAAPVTNEVVNVYSSTITPGLSAWLCDGNELQSTHTFNLAAPVTLYGDTEYVIVIRRINTTGRTVLHGYCNRFETGCLGAQDPRWVSTDSGATWDDPADVTVLFALYGEPPPTVIPPTPTGVISYYGIPPFEGPVPGVITGYCTTAGGNFCAQPFEIGEWTHPTIRRMHSVVFDLQRVGNPGNIRVLVYAWDFENDNIVGNALATGWINVDSLIGPMPAPWRPTIMLNPQTFLTDGWYVLLLDTPSAPPGSYVRWGFDETADSAMHDECREEWDEWTVVEDGCVFFHVLYGVAGTAAPSATNPPLQEEAPDASPHYSYFWNLTNLYAGTALRYEFSGMTEDTVFQVRRLNASGDPAQIVGVYPTEPDGGNGTLVHPTSAHEGMALEVYDLTHDIRLVKHYVAAEPSTQFKSNRDHRCAANCSVGIGAIVYSTKQSGYLHDPTAPQHISIATVRIGEYTILHYRLPTDATPEDYFLSIYDLSRGEETINVSIADLATYNGLGVGDENDAKYFQNFVILNTTGENLPFVTNFSLHGFFGIPLQEGIYNYAILDDVGLVEAEGENLLIVRDASTPSWTLNVSTPSVIPGGDLKSTVKTVNATIHAGAPDQRVVTSFVVSDALESAFKSSYVVTLELPETMAGEIPRNEPIALHIRNDLLPYSLNPGAYEFVVRQSFRIVASTSLLTRADDTIRANSWAIWLLLGILTFLVGLTPIHPIFGGVFVSLLTGAAWRLGWITNVDMFVGICLITGVVLLLILMGVYKQRREMME